MNEELFEQPSPPSNVLEAAAKIEAIMREADCVGMVVLVDKDYMKSSYNFNASWSVLQINSETPDEMQVQQPFGLEGKYESTIQVLTNLVAVLGHLRSSAQLLREQLLDYWKQNPDSYLRWHHAEQRAKTTTAVPTKREQH